MAGNKPDIKANETNLQSRELQTTRSNDNVQNYNVGIKDIDESIFYYFNEVLKPQVTQNGKQINVPLVYASPERWAAMQKDGYYRDKNGKMQAPLITFRRDSLEKNRQLGNKLDGNNPHNFGVFEKKFSKNNVYDKFGILTIEYQKKSTMLLLYLIMLILYIPV